MRIFCAVRHSNDHRYYYGGLWSGNFYPALRQLSHQIIESKTDLLPTSKFMHIASDFTPEELEMRTRITEQILDEVRRAHRKQPIDLFLSYFYNSHFDPAGFDKIRRLGIPSVNFYCNSVYQFELVREIAVKVDYAWHAERDARAAYLRAGANPVWVQMGADPAIYHPVETERQRNVGFVGQRYADRDRWIAHLIRAEVPVVLYGPGWNGACEPVTSVPEQPETYLGRATPPAGTKAALQRVVVENWLRDGVFRGTARTWRQFRYRAESRKLAPLLRPLSRGAVPFEQQKNVFSGSAVVLNLSNVWADGRPGSALIPHVRLRDFEAPMCRSCYLTGHTDEIGEFYEIGKEIDTYASPAELVEKTRFYLDHPDAAERLRERGLRRAATCHTWRNRFEELFTKIGLTATG
jgi:spore maturation protein CgeB